VPGGDRYDRHLIASGHYAFERDLNDQSSGGGTRDYVRLRCWPLVPTTRPGARRSA
jgi:hypothetical protein